MAGTLGEWNAMRSKALRFKYGSFWGRHPSLDGIEPLEGYEDDEEPYEMPKERARILPMNRADYRQGQRKMLPRALRKDTFTARRKQKD